MKVSISCVLCAAPFALASAQTPLAFQTLAAPTALAVQARAGIERQAGPSYSFEGFKLFAKDSALLVFVDSSLTGAALMAHTWMFGPPATAAEADSCPPEKVLARKIAREFWRGIGQPPEIQSVIVSVHGTKGSDRWSAIDMYFTKEQLERPWVADPRPF